MGCFDCPTCYLAGHNCLAGLGDDFYKPASKEEVILRIIKNKYPNDISSMINFLKNIKENNNE